MDQLMALENGADDYITKPFDYEIVLAKINSQLRRAYGSYASSYNERTVTVAGLTLNVERLILSLHSDKVIEPLILADELTGNLDSKAPRM